MSISVLSFSFNVLANELRDYHTEYYDDEGALHFKISPFYSKIDSKLPALPDGQVTNVAKPTTIIDNSYGLNSELTYFVSDNFAFNIGLGTGYTKIKNSSLNAFRLLYGSSIAPTNSTKTRSLMLFPLMGTVQYHIAPYGAIRPYIGAGGHATYVYNRSKAFELNNGYGFLFQSGVDFVAKDDALINLDLKYSTMKTKMRIKKDFLETNTDFKSKVKLDSLSVSIGFGFMF